MGIHVFLFCFVVLNMSISNDFNLDKDNSQQIHTSITARKSVFCASTVLVDEVKSEVLLCIVQQNFWSGHFVLSHPILFSV